MIDEAVAKNSGPWPTCVKCKSARVGSASTLEATPPDPVTARCTDCGHVWAICGAKNRKGARCGKTPMQNGRCANHGGKSTGRPLVHGRRSKFLPPRLQERAEEALADRDLVSMAEDLALIDAWVTERYERLSEESHAHLWGLAIMCFEGLEKHRADGSLAMEPEAGKKFDQLREILVNGQGSSAAEREIIVLQEHKRKVSDTEIKRQAALQQFVSAKELNALLAVILTTIRETVKDAGERAAVGARLLALVGSGQEASIGHSGGRTPFAR